MGELRRSILDQAHRRLGARMVEFGGWDMPLSYPAGTLAEHRACRTGAVAFDVSHLGSIVMKGPEAFERIQRTFTNDLGLIGPGRAQYTHLLDELDASVLDDLIVWWLDDEEFQVLPNAANTAMVLSISGGRDVTAERALVAVQGPAARRLLGGVSTEAAAVPRFGVVRFEWDGRTCVAAGTGYTGEDGVECSVSADVAESFWEAVVDAGVSPAGLGARDTLRLEAGLPLHGHELGPGITPLQAGLGWVVAWEKGPFRGREALAEERTHGVGRRLRGLAVHGRQPPRAGCVLQAGGEVAGEVTSGNFSPMLGHGIALGFLPPQLGVGSSVSVVIRGHDVPASVVRTPFVSSSPPAAVVGDVGMGSVG